MKWDVRVLKKIEKKSLRFPKSVRVAFLLLILDLERHGPAINNKWKNHGKLKGIFGDKRHCHILKGRPTYVCCWEVINNAYRIIEVYYVGTHEKAPY